MEGPVPLFLRSRLRKIERITGRGVTRTGHIAQWWVALRAQEPAGRPSLGTNASQGSVTLGYLDGPVAAAITACHA